RACAPPSAPGSSPPSSPPRTPTWSPRCTTPARSAWARPPPASSATPSTARPTSARPPATRGRPTAPPAAPAAARPPRSPPGWWPRHRATTAAGRCGSRPRSAAWSGSSPAAGGAPASRWASAPSACPPTGPSRRPPSTPPDGGYLAAATRADPGRRLRIGRWTTPMLADARVDPACLAAVDAAAAALAAAGHEVEDVAPPVDPAASDLFETLWRVLALATPVPPEREGELQPVTRWLRERGREVSVPRLLVVLAEVQAEVRAGARRLSGYDLLLSPTLAAPQAPVGWFTAGGDPAEDFARQKRFSPYCAVYNITGQPAVSLPYGLTDRGAPVGVMLAARPGEDGLLWRAAAQLEASSPVAG